MLPVSESIKQSPGPCQMNAGSSEGSSLARRVLVFILVLALQEYLRAVRALGGWKKPRCIVWSSFLVLPFC